MILIYFLIFIATFLFMEFMAWFTHKYIMHGFLWVWHKSHHTVHDHALEKNDLFALVFSLPSIGILYFASHYSSGILWAIGLGIAAYGLFYFIFHDVIVHRRIKIKLKSKNKYLQRIIQAHYVHHRKHSKEGGEAFGFLYAPKKYYNEANEEYKKKKQSVKS